MLAFVLSIVPGVGHIYRGKPIRGIMWFFGVVDRVRSRTAIRLSDSHSICAANAAFSDTMREDVVARWTHGGSRRLP